MTRHVKESNLALFISGDLSLFERAAMRLHLSGCPDCRTRIEAYRFDRQRLKEDAAQLPLGVDWDRLAQEMTANIRVAWWLNFPSADPASLGHALNKLVHGRETIAAEPSVAEDRGPVVDTTSSRVELRENGNSLVMSQGAALPVSVSVNGQGTATASYVNDAGEITLTGVAYVQ